MSPVDPPECPDVPRGRVSTPHAAPRASTPMQRPKKDRRIIEGLLGAGVGRITVREAALHMAKSEPSYDVERACRGEQPTAPPRSAGGHHAGSSAKIVLLPGLGPGGAGGPRAGTPEWGQQLHAPRAY